MPPAMAWNHERIGGTSLPRAQNLQRRPRQRDDEIAYGSKMPGDCMTPTQFRKLVLGLDGVVEASHMNHPDFRAANGRIFATLSEDLTKAMASLTPEQQADFIARAPETFVPAAGAWGRGGSTMIVLKSADAEIVGEAVTLAWQRISAMPASRSRVVARKMAANKSARKRH
jgi:hypothetical protein